MAIRTVVRLLLVAGVYVVALAIGRTADAGGHGDVPDPFDRSWACLRATCGDIFAWPNSPSTPCQCIGCGVGAGYHADLVYGSVPTWRKNHHGVQWVAHSPRPHAHCFSPGMVTPPVSHPMHAPVAVPRPPMYHHRHELVPPPSPQDLFAPPTYQSSPPATESVPHRPMPAEPESPSDVEPSAHRYRVPAF